MDNQILKEALSEGGEYADLFLESTTTTRLVMEDKKIETIHSGVDAGANLRVISDLKTAFATSNDTSPSSLAELAKSVSGALGKKSQGAVARLQKKSPTITLPVLKAPVSIPLAQKLELVRRAEKLAWSLDKRLVQVCIRYADTFRNVKIITSDGCEVETPQTHIVLSATLTASDGKEFVKGYESMGGHKGFELFDEENLEEMIRRAAARAFLNLTAKRARGGTMPVVISAEAGGTFVHEAVGHGLEADLACQGLSVYGDKLGKKVASSLVNVIDDPTIPGKRGSYLFDDEGIPAQRALLIENGILKNYMFDRLTAMKAGAISNGHGRRESYQHRPIVRMSNTMILPGRDNPEEILKSVDRGLFVKMMGGGQVNTVNGDFMFEVTEGYEIEFGRIGAPVRGATLTGNGPDVLNIIDKVGNDLGASIGTCGKDGQNAPVSDAMPTIRVPQMVVGGLIE